MCWSGEASAVVAMIGMTATAYAAYKKTPPALWITLGYFTLMEILQAYTYGYIDQCELPPNQIATLLGYLHITFQPFFISTLSMHFIPAEVRRKIQYWVYAACFFSAIVMLIQLYPFDWAGHCDPRRPLCGPQLCSIHGNWHIAWEVPTNGLGNYFVDAVGGFFRQGFITYNIVAFVLPLFYGSWRLTIYHYIMGPFLSQRLTDNHNEWPAIWCLLSIGFLLIVVKGPLQKWMYVENYPLWRLLGYKPKPKAN